MESETNRGHRHVACKSCRHWDEDTVSCDVTWNADDLEDCPFGRNLLLLDPFIADDESDD